ncbi:60S ribosomal protein L18a [Hibiscus syriacus]|uniref:60S ribosomal protein L18a n=1 Tax=Hibiscus syriacus TaxID=106335 RepID=A0A6A2ZEH2_HIBSY|nr:60S ribosomal protein L18a [Hibiscus syriacus]
MVFGFATKVVPVITTCTRNTMILTTLNGAVEQMYTAMASRHRVRFPCIQIIKTATIPAKLCKRDNTKQFHNSKIKFPLVVKKVRPPTRKLKTTYKASRPNLFM